MSLFSDKDCWDKIHDMSIFEEPFGTSLFVLLFKVTVLSLYVTIMKPEIKLIISAARQTLLGSG